jgi:hypothetical protein
MFFNLVLNRKNTELTSSSECHELYARRNIVFKLCVCSFGGHAQE